MADKVTLVCSECFSRNYSTTKNKKVNGQRLEMRKFCPKCGKHTLHKETKQRNLKMSKTKKDWMFSPKGVFAELKQVQWPTFPEFMKTSGLVISFTVLFGLYFFLCEVICSKFISWIVGLQPKRGTNKPVPFFLKSIYDKIEEESEYSDRRRLVR